MPTNNRPRLAKRILARDEVCSMRRASGQREAESSDRACLKADGDNHGHVSFVDEGRNQPRIGGDSDAPHREGGVAASPVTDRDRAWLSDGRAPGRAPGHKPPRWDPPAKRESTSLSDIAYAGSDN